MPVSKGCAAGSTGGVDSLGGSGTEEGFMERPHNNVLRSRALHDQRHLRCFAITGEFEEMGSVEDDS